MKKNLLKLSAGEWQSVFFWSLALIIVTGLPYVIGYIFAPSDLIYNGLHAINTGDTTVYYSYIKQGTQGNIFYKDLFTSEQQNTGTFNIVWFTVGLIGRLFGLSVPTAFHVGRLLSIPFFVYVAFVFLRYFFTSGKQLQFALLMLFFSSGFGVFFADALPNPDFINSVAYQWPVDLWLVEATTFTALYQSAHFIWSLSFMMAIFLLVLKALNTSNWQSAVFAGLMGLIYFNFHPYYMPVVYATIGLYWIWQCWYFRKINWNYFAMLLIIGTLSFPSVLYHGWLIYSSPVIGSRALQNVTHLSGVHYVLIGYGALVIGFIVGVIYMIRKHLLTNKWIFLLIWFGVNIAMIFAPFPFSSRYTQGLHVIFVVFTVQAIYVIWNKIKKYKDASLFIKYIVKNQFLWIFTLCIVFFSTTAFNLTRDIYFFTVRPTEVRNFFYLTEGQIKVCDFLNNQEKNKVVLADPLFSMFIPGCSGQSVFAAHLHETLSYEKKAAQIGWFYSAQVSPEQREKFMKEQGIDYVIFSNATITDNINSPGEQYFNQVLQFDDITLYQLSDRE